MATAGGGLVASAFVELSENGSASLEETGQEAMLEVSRREIRKSIRDSDGNLRRLPYRILVFIDLYIWEPICTSLRLLQLAAIFVPVIVAVPAIWIGRRVPERDNERIGTLWWYSLLVRSMELAGPAFIKVTSSKICPRGLQLT